MLLGVLTVLGCSFRDGQGMSVVFALSLTQILTKLSITNTTACGVVKVHAHIRSAGLTPAALCCAVRDATCFLFPSTSHTFGLLHRLFDHYLLLFLVFRSLHGSCNRVFFQDLSAAERGDECEFR